MNSDRIVLFLLIPGSRPRIPGSRKVQKPPESRDPGIATPKVGQGLSHPYYWTRFSLLSNPMTVVDNDRKSFFIRELKPRVGKSICGALVK